MSDSSCSNCSKECEFRDYSYECWVNEIKKVKEHLNKEDIDLLKKVISKYDNEELKYSLDVFHNLNNTAKEIVSMWEDVEKVEKSD
jgi:hypothetical protein